MIGKCDSLFNWPVCLPYKACLFYGHFGMESVPDPLMYDSLHRVDRILVSVLFFSYMNKFWCHVVRRLSHVKCRFIYIMNSQ